MRGLGVKDTSDYKANLVKHDALAKKSLKVRIIVGIINNRTNFSCG